VAVAFLNSVGKQPVASDRLLLLLLLLLLHLFIGLFFRTTWISWYQSGTSWINMRQEMMGFWDGSGISWTIRKQSAPHTRQTTTPTPHHSHSILQAGCPSCHPANSVKAQKARHYTKQKDKNDIAQ